MSTTPEALRLAQIIEQFGGASAYQAAAELRRLAAVEAAIPSPAPAQPADERAAFEAWADKYPGLEDDHGYVNLRYLGLHKQYVDFDVQRAWTTWQARAALAAQAQAGPDGALEMLLAHRDGIPWGEVRSAFNAAIDRLNVAMAKEAHEATQAAAPCVCPSGDGSLRWPCPQHPPETAIPAGWTALRMERVPGHPETVAYGPAEAMERLRVELDAYHQGLKVDQYRASLPVVEPGAIQAPAPAQAIERDEQMDRDYIPLPGGWEMQTKGNGSTLRLLDKKDGERHPLPLPDHLCEFIERMAREIHAAVQAPVTQDGWKPIETAPQDGTKFWAYRERDRKQGEACRVPRDDCEMWYFAGTSAAVETYPGIQPSHWRPLPPAPGATQQQQPTEGN